MAFTPQTSVTDRTTRIQGRYNATEPIITETRTADGSTAIDPGMAVIKSTADYDVTLPTATFSLVAFQGVVGWSPLDKEKAISTGDKSYVANDELTIVIDGVVEVLVTDTVAKDGAVYFTHTAGDSDVHTFRADLDTNKAQLIPAIYMEDGVSGDIVRIRISQGARTASLIYSAIV
jgi:hypothetical protein